MPLSIKNAGGPAGQLKIKGPVSILGQVGPAAPIEDGTFAHPYTLLTNGVSVFKTYNPSSPAYNISWRSSGYAAINFKFTMPTVYFPNSCYIKAGISNVNPWSSSYLTAIDTYIGILPIGNTTTTLATADDGGGNYAAPDDGTYGSFSNSHSVLTSGDLNATTPGTDYILSVTTYNSTYSSLGDPVPSNHSVRVVIWVG